MQDASSKQQTKQKYKPNNQQTGLPPHSALPIRGKTNKEKFSTNLTLYEAHTNHWTNLRRAETKSKKEFKLLQGKNSTFLERIQISLKPGKGDLKHSKLKKKKNEKAEKYYTNEGTN